VPLAHRIRSSHRAPAAVAQLEVGELSALGVRGEAGETPSAGIGEPYLRARGADVPLRTITRMPFGRAARSSMLVISATHAPGRISRSLSQVGVYAFALYQRDFYDLSWLKLVRTSAAAGDGVEGLAEVVGERVGGGDGLPSGLDLYGAVGAGGLDEFAD
jgi:hypothetical protein